MEKPRVSHGKARRSQKRSKASSEHSRRNPFEGWEALSRASQDNLSREKATRGLLTAYEAFQVAGRLGIWQALSFPEFCAILHMTVYVNGLTTRDHANRYALEALEAKR